MRNNKKIEKLSEVKKNGVTFTPSKLADYLSSKIIKYCDSLSDKIILDPACGNGSLLISISKMSNLSVGKLIGYDTNINYVYETISNIKKINIDNFEINNVDFLEKTNHKIDLFSKTEFVEYADIIIANPPYVSTQNLGSKKSQQIANDFGLKGKVDLYFPFLIGMTNVLKENGLLGVITSNRYLTTKSGADIRKFLLNNYDILEVIDLGDSQLFNTAVLPAILIAKKKNNNKVQSSCMFTRLYETNNTSNNIISVDSIYNILEKEKSGVYKVTDKIYNYTMGVIKYNSDKTDIWKMTNESESGFIDIIQNNTYCHIGDLFKVRVGIKSCADNVFIKSHWDNNILSEQDLFRPMISRENIKRWNCSSSNLTKILYPHYDNNGKRAVYDINKYPKVREYLFQHKEQLENRSYLIASGRKWYEMWVPQEPKLWNYPKIVFPDISTEALFSYDESGAIVNGNCYWIVAQTEEQKRLLLLIEGIANSDLMGKYHELCFNNKLYSGRKRYISQYIEKYPLPDPNSKFANNIIRIVEQLNNTNDKFILESLTKELNQNVNYAFGITD